MPTTDPAKFFDKYRSWQWIKHTILSDYLVVWARKVGSTSKTIHIVDAFAGAGHYEGDGGSQIDGSPIIEARAALAYHEQFPDRDITLTCIERDAENFAKLEGAMAAFGDLVQLWKGDFYRYADQLTKLLKSEPALILLDPIGLKAITADRCLHLLQRVGKTDVLVIVDFGIVHRAAGQLLPDGTPNPSITGARKLGENIDAFFGTQSWRSIALDWTLGIEEIEEKESRYLDLYFANVLGDRYRYKTAYQVRSRHGGPIQYWLVHASNHEDAFWLMNDCIVKVDRLLLGRTYEAPDQLPGIVEGTVEAYDAHIERQLRQAIVEMLPKLGGKVSFRRLRHELVFGAFYGRVKESAYTRVTKELIRDGKLVRNQPRVEKLELSDEISDAG